MVFKSDAQRIGFFANRGFIRSQIKPIGTLGTLKKRKARTGGPIDKAPISMKQKEFLAKKIRQNLREGRPMKQAIAIAFSQARKKFPRQKRFVLKGNPNGKGLTTKRITNLLVLLFGTAVALSILRRIRRT